MFGFWDAAQYTEPLDLPECERPLRHGQRIKFYCFDKQWREGTLVRIEPQRTKGMYDTEWTTTSFLIRVVEDQGQEWDTSISGDQRRIWTAWPKYRS